MFYSEEVVEEVRERSDIVDIISGYVHLQKKGKDHFGLCPFHSEKSPSFSVSRDKQMYYCFGCGAGGNVFTFLMEYESLSFKEAVEMLAGRAGVALPQTEPGRAERERADQRARLLKINREAAEFFYYQLRQPQGQAGYAYLRGRALSDDTLRRFGLGFASRTGSRLYPYLKQKGYSDELLKESGLFSIQEQGIRDRFWNRVIFPIMDVNSRVIGFGGRVMGDGTPKYLNSPETAVFDKGRNLYGLNYARTSRQSFILACEGYMDVIAMHQAGFTNAVASLGTAFTGQQANLLKRYTKTVILTYDSDDAGVRAALRAIPVLKSAGISAKVLNLKPYKDPDEFIKNRGAEAFQERIDQAQNSFLFEIDALKRRYDLGDPEQRTRFYQETAEKLLEFPEALERDNYIRAVSDAQRIPYEDLRRLVSRLGVRYAGRAPVSLNEEELKRRDERKKGRESGIRRSEKLLLTWLAEKPALLKKIEGIVGPEDFTDPLFRQLAGRIFADGTAGSLNPAQIISSFADDETACREAAAIFSSSQADTGSDTWKKAFSDTVLKIRRNSLDEAGKKAADIVELQEIIRQQAALKTLRVSLDE